MNEESLFRNYGSFEPAYPGDNPNRAWVRKKAEEKGVRIDIREAILLFSQPSIDILFCKYIQKEFPNGV